MQKRNIVIDTSKLMENISDVEKLMENYQIVLPIIVLEELDNHKDNYRDQIRSYKGRTAIKFINKYFDKIIFDKSYYSSEKNDNIILESAEKNNAVIFTGDLCMKVKAKSLGIEVVESFECEVDTEYCGFTTLYTDNEEDNINLAKIYEDMSSNPLDLNINEYLLVKNEYEILVDKLKYTDDGFVRFNKKSFSSSALGSIRPIDEYQDCLADCLINNQMTLVRGKAGSGKSLLSLSYAMDMVESGKYNKLIILANPIGSKNAAKLGFYPGSRTEKILDSFVGSMLASKFGDIEGVYQLMQRGSLEILPFSDIRGYDTSGMNAIVYIIEAQNLDIDLMKLAIQRTSDDCKLIIDGDNNSQVDMAAYEGASNGMRRVSEIFRGKDLYGEVELRRIHRSKISEIADKM